MFESLGLTLRVFRELSGCSQAEIARKAQIGKSQLSKYENGKELPRLESLGKVIAVLGTTPLMVFYVNSVLDRANALTGGIRARFATTSSTVDGSTGFGTCSWYPAASARWRSAAVA